MSSNQGAGNGDRRKFLTSAGAATLGIGAICLISGRAVAAVKSDDLGVIQTALALEHGEAHLGGPNLEEWLRRQNKRSAPRATAAHIRQAGCRTAVP